MTEKEDVQKEKVKTAKEKKADLKKKEKVEKENELLEIVKQLQEENKKKDEKMNELLQAIALNNTKPTYNTTMNKTSDDIIYSVTTHTINKVYLISPDKNTTVTIEPYVTTEISQRDLREVFKRRSNRELFEKGLCIFEDAENEKVFRLNVYNDFRDEIVIDAIKNMNSNDLVGQLNKWTKHKNPDCNDITHTLFYKIVKFEDEGLLGNLSRQTYSAIESYFGETFSNGIMKYKAFANLMQ